MVNGYKKKCGHKEYTVFFITSKGLYDTYDVWINEQNNN